MCKFADIMRKRLALKSFFKFTLEMLGMTRNVLLVVGLSVLLSGNAIADNSVNQGFYVGAGYGIITFPKDEGISFSDGENGNLQLGYSFSEKFSIEAQYSTSASDADARASFQGIDMSEILWDDMVEWNPGMTIYDAMTIFPSLYVDVDMAISASIDTAALYGVYRSTGDLYFKAKAGAVSIDTTLTAQPITVTHAITDQNFQEHIFEFDKNSENFDQIYGAQSVKIKESETDFTAGIGVGYKIGAKFFAELEYTMLNDDFDYYSLGVNYRF